MMRMEVRVDGLEKNLELVRGKLNGVDTKLENLNLRIKATPEPNRTDSTRLEFIPSSSQKGQFDGEMMAVSAT